MKKEKLTITITKDLKEKLLNKKKETGVSISVLIEQIVRNYFNDNKNKEIKIKI